MDIDGWIAAERGYSDAQILHKKKEEGKQVDQRE